MKNLVVALLSLTLLLTACGKETPAPGNASGTVVAPKPLTQDVAVNATMTLAFTDAIFGRTVRGLKTYRTAGLFCISDRNGNRDCSLKAGDWSIESSINGVTTYRATEETATELMSALTRSELYEVHELEFENVLTIVANDQNQIACSIPNERGKLDPRRKATCQLTLSSS